MQVYLDFDGVLCDSVEENFIISYLAFYEVYSKSMGMTDPSKLWRNKTWRESYKKDLEGEIKIFREYRPFIKSAEDFILLQRAIATGSLLVNEEKYTSFREKELKPGDYDQFYVWRKKVFEEDPQWWYSLHSLYDGVREVLLSLVKDDEENRFIILSTKQEAYIQAILHYHSIPWRYEQIKTKKEKLSYIHKETKGKEAVLIDDQREFGKESLNYPQIKFYLASWGYIREEWLSDLPVYKLSLTEFPELISEMKNKKGK